MVGNENLDAALGDDDYFGFGVDAGMGCIAAVSYTHLDVYKRQL